jgi:L-amino acid N-acyltransferase YncA
LRLSKLANKFHVVHCNAEERTTMAGQSKAVHSGEPSVVIRRASAADAEVCGRICFDAFTVLANRHNFPPDWPAPEVSIGVLSAMFSHPGFYCVVAEQDGKIIGSNCLDERSPIAGVGPITVDALVQNRAAGRALMQAVLTRATERKFAGVRLVQAAYHNRSLALYAKLGFVVREPLSCMQGPAMKKMLPGYSARPAVAGDLAACNDVCLRVHGHERGGEVQDAIQHGAATVAERDGRVTAYASSMAFSGHAVGQTNEDLKALIGAAAAFQGPGILVPTRNAELFRWCLESGLRVVQPMTLMTMGLYNEPAGAYLPSVLF